MPAPTALRDDGGVERDVFGFPVYPNEGGLARRLREARPEAERGILDQLRALTPETMPQQAPPTMTPEQALLMALGIVPGIGDAVGVGADAYTLATDPESRTMGNAALAAAGLLPFVPSGLGTVRRVLDDTTPVRRVAKKATTQAGRSANGAVAASEMGPDAAAMGLTPEEYEALMQYTAPR